MSSLQAEQNNRTVTERDIAERVRFRRKDIPGLVIRYAIAIGLVVFVASRLRDVDFTKLYQISGPSLLYLIFLKGIIYLSSAYRLKLVLKDDGIRMPLHWVFITNKIGILVSYLTPSSVLSDVSKLFVFRKFGASSIKTLIVLFLDRLAGLIAILILLLSASLSLYARNAEQFWRIFFGATLVKTAILVGAAGCVIVFPFLLVKVGVFKNFLVRQFSFLTVRLALQISIISLMSHMGFCFLILECARATNSVSMDLIDSAILFPMSTIATAVPTTPGSIGVGQMVYKYLIDSLTGTATDSGILIFTLLQLLDIPFMILAFVSSVYLIIKNRMVKKTKST